LQGQGLGAVLIVVGEDQFIIIYKDGIYESIDDFFSVIKIVDVAVLIFTDPFHDLFLGKLTALQLQLQDTGL
jgi:Na+/H+ antiporter NhaB